MHSFFSYRREFFLYLWVRKPLYFGLTVCLSPNRVEIFGSRVLNEYTSILFSFSSSKVVKNGKSRYERTCAHDSKTLALKLVKLFWIDSQNFIYFSINGHMFKEV